MDRRNNRRDAEGSSVITANRLLDGRIVWLGEDGTWEPLIRNARIYSNADIENALKVQADRAQQDELVGVYGVQVTRSPSGIVPVTSRERIRAVGPSVHPEFTPEWQAVEAA